LLDLVKQEKNLKNFYSYTVAADIVSAHMQIAEPIVKKKAYYMKGLWEIIVKREILQLVEKGKSTPRVKSAKGPNASPPGDRTSYGEESRVPRRLDVPQADSWRGP